MHPADLGPGDDGDPERAPGDPDLAEPGDPDLGDPPGPPGLPWPEPDLLEPDLVVKLREIMSLLLLTFVIF